MMTKHKQIPRNDNTDEITRFGVSMSIRLLKQFDALIAEQGYTNRSEAIRDLVRNRLVESRCETDENEMVGAVVMVYDHEVRMLEERLTHLQHQMGHLVISTLHVHLNERDCLEVVALKGPAQKLRDLANKLLSLKGVKHGKLVITGLGEEIFHSGLGGASYEK